MPLPSYDRLLLAGERVRMVATPHYIALVRTLSLRAAALLGLWLVARFASSALLARLLDLPGLREAGPEGGPLPLGAWLHRGCGWLALVVLGLAVFDALRWRSTFYVLTDQRLLQVRGVLGITSLDSPLDKVTEIGVEQSFLGQRLDYGDVLILRNTEDGGNKLPAVSRPLAFNQALQKARQARTAPPAMMASNLQAGLKELISLREHDLVTLEEFEAKKKELLGRF